MHPHTIHTNVHSTTYRDQRNSMIYELLFPSSILAVKLNRKSLVIVLEMEIYKQHAVAARYRDESEP